MRRLTFELALLALSLVVPASAQEAVADSARADTLRTEMVRMRAFVRAAETQALKVEALLARYLGDPLGVPVDTFTPEPEPEPPPADTVAPEPADTSAFRFSDDFETGDTSHSEGGFAWGRTTYTVDSILARSGTRALRGLFNPNDASGAEWRFSHPELPEYWMEFYVYFPDGTEPDGAGGTLNRYVHTDDGGATNNKFFSFWADSYQGRPRGAIQLWHTGVDGSRINIARSVGNKDSNSVYYPDSYGGGGYDFKGDTDIVKDDTDRGRWIQMRFHIRVANFGQENGVFEIWKDGTLILQLLDDPFYDNAGTDNYLKNGYLLGWANTAYLVETSIFIDDFSIRSRDPGW